MSIRPEPSPGGGTTKSFAEIEQPARPNAPALGWVSDAVAEMLRRLGIDYVALVPGSSYRGLHDSLVNYLGNSRPQMLVCLHEEHAVAIAHGYAKVTEKPMAAAVHANVGLMHATMAIYDAWCDRAPVIVLGATGPVDAAKRRPWIDWIHTAQDQGALIRSYVKWDDQPGSAAAAVESLARAAKIAVEEPRAPVYICLDVGLQESPLDKVPEFPDLARRRPALPPAPPAEVVAEAAALLKGARHPLILAGRVSRNAEAWKRRVALAEALGAKVLTDLKAAAAFPTDHPLHAAPAGMALDAPSTAALREADVILNLDWIDLGGTLRSAFGGATPAKVISASLDEQLANGWSKDHQAPTDIDVALPCPPDSAVAALLPLLAKGGGAPIARVTPKPAADTDSGPIDLRRLARAFAAAAEGHETTVLRLPLGWPAGYTPFRGPLDYVGFDGGGGVGSGPGMAVGSALALMGSGRIPVAILGDGDTLMGANALWTAAHYRIPLLIIVANNRSYFNDEMHQQRVAEARDRPVGNRWIGQRIDDPAVDLPALARSLGFAAEETVTDAASLTGALREAMAAVAAGECRLVDVSVTPGYASAASKDD
jgi:thiamine pyrophosphate-dependent acetolactate synthase large subunit-like protein